MRLSRQNVLQASLWLIGCRITGVFLGLGVMVLIAQKFGVSVVTDAYFVALVIPLTLSLQSRSAVSALFIPIFTEVRLKKGEDEAWHLVGNLLSVILFFLISFPLLYFLFAPYVIKLVAPGFSPSTLEMAVGLTRLAILCLFFTVLFALGESILHSYRHFLIPSTSYLLSDAGTIMGLLFLTPLWGIKGVIWGMLAGFFCRFLIVTIAIFRRSERKFKLGIDFQNPYLKRIFHNIPYILLAISVLQLNQLVDKILASFLGPGRVSALGFAGRLSGFFPLLLGGGMTAAVFPTFSHEISSGRKKDFGAHVSFYLRIFSFLIFPLMVILLIIPGPLVRLLLERKAFGPEATGMVSYALFFYSLGMLAFTLNILLRRSFIALQRFRALVCIGFGGVILNILGSIILMKYMDHGGIALATSLASMVKFILLFIFLKRELGSHLTLDLKNIARVAFAASIMALSLYFFSRWMKGVFFPAKNLGYILYIIVCVLEGLAVYLGLGYILKLPQMRVLFRIWKRGMGGDARRLPV